MGRSVRGNSVMTYQRLLVVAFILVSLFGRQLMSVVRVPLVARVEFSSLVPPGPVELVKDGRQSLAQECRKATPQTSLHIEPGNRDPAAK